MILQTPWWASDVLVLGMFLGVIPLVFSSVFWEERRWIAGSTLILLGAVLFAVGDGCGGMVEEVSFGVSLG